MSTEIVPRTESAVATMQPRDMGEAMRLAEMLAKSDLVPGAYRGKPANVLLATIAGAELGFGAALSLRTMHIIDGKPTLSADAMGALVMRQRDVCRYLTLVESTDERAVYETHRVGSPEPVRLAYTADQAAAAGLLNKATWKQHRAAMLRARALAALCRAAYPDLVAGLYDSDSAELEPAPEPQSRPVRRTRATPASEPVEATVEPMPTPNVGRGADGRTRLLNWREFVVDGVLTYGTTGSVVGQPLCAVAHDKLVIMREALPAIISGERLKYPALDLADADSACLVGVEAELSRREPAPPDDDVIPEFEDQVQP